MHFKKNILVFILTSFITSSIYAEVYRFNVTHYADKCYLDMSKAPALKVKKGDTLIFSLKDPSMRSQPFSITEEKDSIIKYKGAKVDRRKKTLIVKVTETTPSVLYYSCARTRDSGNNITIK